MKFTGHTYAYNSLTNFEYEPHAIPEILLCEFVESCMGKLVKLHLVSWRVLDM